MCQPEKRTRKPDPVPGRFEKRHPPFLASGMAWWVATAAVLAVTTGIRLRLLGTPLERDEGEFAYGGQLLLEGAPLYQHIYTMKWPGTHALYALFMAVFGQTPGGIHAGLIVVNVATAVLVFVLARRLCGDAGAFVAAGTYALLSINPPTLGLAAHATHFVALAALGGILLLHRIEVGTSRTRIFLAGLLLGMAALLKQPGVVFGVFAAIWLAWNEASQPDKRWRRLAVRLGCLLLGALLPFVVTCVIVAAAGTFARFWQFTFEYAFSYVSICPWDDRIQILRLVATALFNGAPGLWGGAALGLILIFCDESMRCSRPFVLGFTGFSFLAVCAGGYFREHHFILLFPAAGLLAGMAVKGLSQFMTRLRLRVPRETVPILLFTIAAACSLIQWQEVFFRLSPAQVSWALYGINPFSQSPEVGRYLAAHCPRQGRIAVLGSEPQLCFYSHRRSATGHIYMYPLTEPQPYAEVMQKEAIREIERANPDYVVFVHFRSSWLVHEDAPTLIFEWYEQYKQAHLELVAWTDMPSGRQVKYHWLPTQGSVAPESRNWLAILRNRKPADPATVKGK
jgi:hypothetical protein